MKNTIKFAVTIFLTITLFTNCSDDDSDILNQYSTETTATYLDSSTALSVENRIDIKIINNDSYNGNYLIRRGYKNLNENPQILVEYFNLEGEQINLEENFMISGNEYSFIYKISFQNEETSKVEGFSYFLKRDNANESAGVYGVSLKYAP